MPQDGLKIVPRALLAALGPLLVALGRSWLALGASWAHLGACWGDLGAILGDLGAMLGAQEGAGRERGRRHEGTGWPPLETFYESFFDLGI